MSTYARIDSLSQLVRDLISLTPEQFAALNGNPKQAYLKPLVIDAAPAPTATQLVVDAGYVIEPARVRQTWSLRDKTADELEADGLAAELSKVDGYITDIQTQLDISNATRGAMTTNQRLNTLEADTRALLKAAKYTLRRMKRGG